MQDLSLSEKGERFRIFTMSLRLADLYHKVSWVQNANDSWNAPIDQYFIASTLDELIAAAQHKKVRLTLRARAAEFRAERARLGLPFSEHNVEIFAPV